MDLGNTIRRCYHLVPLRWCPPRGIRASRELNDHFQWWPIERMREYQVDRLRALLHYAEESVPYYTALFRQAGFRAGDLRALSDLEALPLLDKASVREHQKVLRARDWERWKPVVHHTGGSTGQRLEILMARQAYFAHEADRDRHFAWAGYRMGQRLAVFTLWETFWGTGPWHFHRPRNWLYFNTDVFNRETLGAMVARLAEFNPEGIMAFPSHLYWIHQHLAETGEGRVRPRVLMTDSEMLYDFQRREVEALFGTRIFDFYGMSENVASASQCDRGSYHVAIDYAHVEVVRSDGSPARPGEMGEIVGTNFHNYAMPLIRYRTGDLAVPGTGPCPCGRALPTLERISGRTQDLVATPEGFTVFPHRLFAFHEVESVRELQIVQEEVHRFRIRAVAKPGYRPDDGKRLAQILEHGLGFSLDARVEVVPEIPRTLRGKFRLVDCRVPGALWTGDVDDAASC